MSKFLLKIGIFAVIVAGVSYGIRIVAPYDWAIDRLGSKLQYMESQAPGTYNTVFFGSSRVYRQIDPITFDSVYSSLSGHVTRSYNLGVPNVFAQQSHYLLQRSARRLERLGVDRVILEVQPFQPITGRGINYYWLDTRRFLASAEQSYDRFGLSARSSAQIGTLGRAYVRRGLNAGTISEMFAARGREYTFGGPGWSRAGFYALDAELADTGDEDLLTRRSDFLAGNGERFGPPIDARVALIRRALADTAEASPFPAHLREWSRTARELREHGIELWAFLPPTVYGDLSHARRIISTLQHLESEYRVDLSDPDRYPQLYSNALLFDRGHVDGRGAAIMSAALARAFAELARAP